MQSNASNRRRLIKMNDDSGENRRAKLIRIGKGIAWFIFALFAWVLILGLGKEFGRKGGQLSESTSDAPGRAIHASPESVQKKPWEMDWSAPSKGETIHGQNQYDKYVWTSRMQANVSVERAAAECRDYITSAQGANVSMAVCMSTKGYVPK
jgi:hypothetical protein